MNFDINVGYGINFYFYYYYFFGEMDMELITKSLQSVFDEPSGNDSVVALNLSPMGKGEAWVNGQSIGRYWVSFLTPKGKPSQYM